MWRPADEEVDQGRPVEVNPLNCRWSLTITAVSHRRGMIFSDPRLHPTAYWLVWDKQDFLRTDFLNLSVNCSVHIYAASNQFLFFSSLFGCCWLTQVREPFCSLSRLSHNSTSFVECQLASRQKSAVNHTLILEEIQIEFSSHFMSLPYESVRATSDVVVSYPLSPPPCYKRVINELSRDDSLCNNDDVTWTCWSWTTVLLDAMCSVITLTHVNYKLLILYRICYGVCTRSPIINYKWNEQHF